MSELTPNLKLFKYNTETDAKQPFSINDCMNANWDKIDASLGSLEICDIGMALYVDESKGKRRYLNGQIVDRNTNTEAFFTRLKQITTLHPSLLCTEEEWQTAKTMSAFGQVGKFVFNYSGADIVSVRLPRVVNVQGLFDLQNLGMTVAESLPNIKGEFGVTKGIEAPYGRGVFNSKTSSSTFAGHTNATLNNARADFTFDASRSSSTYKDNAPVQQEAVQYPYFIQIATGSETENNIINEIELNNPYSLFDSKYSDHELNNLSWLKSEGQWNAKAVYPTAYNELLTEYNNSASTTETEGSITFKRTPKGYKIALADQETAINTKYTTDGIAWYYILDITNEKFKLPRTKFGFEGLRTNVGDDIRAGLPNITGTAQTAPGRAGYVVSGALSMYTTQNATNVYSPGSQANGTQYGISFNASRSNSIYGNSTTVQPPATQMYLYFYVGETVQNASLIDAGRIGEQVANCITRNDCKAYVTETYQNGTSWYRVWSDGWCEQGGRYNSKGAVTVELLKAFANINYTASASLMGSNGAYIGRADATLSTLTPSSFKIDYKTVTQEGAGTATGYFWQACGYIA